MKINKLKIFKIVAILFALLFLYLLFKDYQPQIEMMFNAKERGRAIAEIRDHGLIDVFIIMIVLYLATIIPGVPVVPIGIIAGICFGPLWGTLINTFSIGLGNVAAINFISYLKKDLEKTYKNNRFTSHFQHAKNPLMSLIVGYSIPIIPSYLVSLQASKDEQKFNKRIIFMTALLGPFPISLIYALGGNAIFSANWQHLLELVVIIVIFFIFANTLLKKMIKDEL
ncbi:VTT domain-containing protein [Fructilactobacillus sp. Tb1]|uniref:VTT domain-containing protein n=1 Tax=Fructilactobacillus sp. Tb1 TaxID=3422304 RepID=UPI003D2B1452